MAEQNQQQQANQSIYERARSIGADLAKQQVQERGSVSRSEHGQLTPSNTPRIKEAENDNVRQGRQLGGRGM
jgi:hypothetical protein